MLSHVSRIVVPCPQDSSALEPAVTFPVPGVLAVFPLPSRSPKWCSRLAPPAQPLARPAGLSAPHTHHWLPLAPSVSDPGRPTAAREPHRSPGLLLPHHLAAAFRTPCSAHRVRLHPGLDLPFCSSPHSASPSAPRSGICTETLRGWSPRTGHAQKPGLALVSSRKLLHSGGSGDFGES